MHNFIYSVIEIVETEIAKNRLEYFLCGALPRVASETHCDVPGEIRSIVRMPVISSCVHTAAGTQTRPV